MTFITLLSDYGTTSEFVGVIHGVIARLCPQARVIDIAHGIPRHAVEIGARVLARSLAFMPAGIHVAVVDPEVGARGVAVALRVGAEERVLVGPDNGLLMPATERLGGVVQAVDISRSPRRLERTGATFYGRDVFAPVAARLAAGAPLEQAGTPLEPGGLSLDPPTGWVGEASWRVHRGGTRDRWSCPRPRHAAGPGGAVLWECQRPNLRLTPGFGAE